MNRMRALLLAGGLTGLVLATMLALGLGPDQSVAATGGLVAASTAGMTPEINPTEVSSTNVDALLEQNRQLRDALKVMQARETQYLRQIEQANQALGQTRRSAVATTDGEHQGYADDDHEGYDDRDDHDDGEHDDHEEYDD
jgi:hypothetical protein